MTAVYFTANHVGQVNQRDRHGTSSSAHSGATSVHEILKLASAFFAQSALDRLLNS
ncbi:hypothetical protein [Ottowia caeni]|uniref:hypothetical protein n=1 Tax=Ottowia caeni TaxID=2870339 RepID=UPI003D749B55